MVLKSIFLLLSVSVLISCKHNQDICDSIDSANRDSIYFRMIPEDTLGGYVLEWDDDVNPAEASEKNLLANRPYETHCYILSSSFDTLGYYIGSSSPRQFAYFVTNQTDNRPILIKFRVGLNPFSSYFDSIDQNNLNCLLHRERSLPTYKAVVADLDEKTRNWSKIKLIEE